jgi:hypothetical protein
MKEITKTVYVTDGGMEFETKEQCERFEKNMNLSSKVLEWKSNNIIEREEWPYPCCAYCEFVREYLDENGFNHDAQFTCKKMLEELGITDCEYPLAYISDCKYTLCKHFRFGSDVTESDVFQKMKNKINNNG